MRILFSLLSLFYITFCKAQSTQIQYLSGTDKDNTVAWDFFCTEGMNSGKWTKIAVPSCWELQGFGTYNYGRDKNPAKEQGLYKYKFTVPADWKNKQTDIVFEGVMTDAEVKINGKIAGVAHQGAFYRFRYDISDKLKYGAENLIEVNVKKHSDNQSVNEAERTADFWIFGGIFRPVYLASKPKENIQSVFIDAKATGELTVKVRTTKLKSIGKVKYTVVSMKDNTVVKSGENAIDNANTELTITTKIDNPLLWTSEYPNRYKINVELITNNTVIHQVSEKFGFRTVEVRPRDGIYVNGVKIKFKGVNRHSFYPTSGRTTSKEINILDINLMKEMNMNAVRMSHYPPDVDFLESCDSLGLFVLDELAGWQYPPYDTEVGKKLVKEMVERDMNHPSIVLWDNGNEGGFNFDLVDDYAKYDIQKRHVIHPWSIFRNTDTQHYKYYGFGPSEHFNGREIVFPTEFLHGLYDGGHGAGLEDYWNMMYHNPLSAGGFLWVYCDEGVARKDKHDSVDVAGHQAPDGILGPYREKEGSFFTIKEIWSPIVFNYKDFNYGLPKTLEVENRYHFTNLKSCKVVVKRVKFGLPSENMKYKTLGDSIVDYFPDILPDTKGRLSLNFKSNENDADALMITAYDPQQREVFTWTFPMKSPAVLNQNVLKNPKEISPLKVVESDSIITIEKNNISIQFSKNSGNIKEIKSNGKLISFSGGPVFQNARTKFKNIKITGKTENSITLLSNHSDKDTLKYFWTILPDGKIRLEWETFLNGEFEFMGVNFNYPENLVTGVKWLGKGPYRVWKNRMKGGQLNVWQKAYNNTATGENWLYPEFKGYHAEVYWAEIQNKEKNFKIYMETEDLFLRLFTPAKTKSYNNNTDPIFPSGNISIMTGINGIGTKFSTSAQTGPQGAKHNLWYVNNPTYSRTSSIVFDFE